MIHRNQNYLNTSFVVSDRDEITDSNLSQMSAHTSIFAGKKNLSFRRSNLKNVDIDPTWSVGTGSDSCLSGIHEDVVIVPDVEKDEIDTLIESEGDTAILERIGKAKAKTLWDLKEATVRIN